MNIHTYLQCGQFINSDSISDHRLWLKAITDNNNKNNNNNVLYTQVLVAALGVHIRLLGEFVDELLLLLWFYTSCCYC